MLTMHIQSMIRTAYSLMLVSSVGKSIVSGSGSFKIEGSNCDLAESDIIDPSGWKFEGVMVNSYSPIAS